MSAARKEQVARFIKRWGPAIGGVILVILAWCHVVDQWVVFAYAGLDLAYTYGFKAIRARRAAQVTQ